MSKSVKSIHQKILITESNHTLCQTKKPGTHAQMHAWHARSNARTLDNKAKNKQTKKKNEKNDNEKIMKKKRKKKGCVMTKVKRQLDEEL